MDNKPVSNSVYFENLNAIRFVAAFLVIIHHVEQFKDMFHKPNHWNHQVVYSIGKLGVVLFFVLSGFLISYLLFKEQEITKTINIKNFYIRRVLRIWPLYFLIVFLALLILPFLNFFAIEGYSREVVWEDLFYKVILYALFLPNLALSLYGFIPYLSQAWSIGVEEQFYLIWPLLNKKVKNKWGLMMVVVIVYLAIKFGLNFLPQNDLVIIAGKFWRSTPIDCMAIGGMFAVLIYQNNNFTRFVREILFARLTQWIVLLITVGSILINLHIPYLEYEFYALLFGALICNFAVNERRIFSMENRILNYLGKISYGLYMFHSIAIVCSIKFLTNFGSLNNYVLYPVAMITSVVLASLSYSLLEKRFINKKGRYSKVISGDEAKEQ